MLVSLTVGKVDAGVAVLLTEDKRLVREPDDHLHPSRLNFMASHSVAEQNFSCYQLLIVS
jgi:hypothetical protein